jgi:hypothetical protein
MQPWGGLMLLLILVLLSAVTCEVLSRLHLQPPAIAYWCLIYLLLIENLSFSHDLEAPEMAHGVTKQLLRTAAVLPAPIVFKKVLIKPKLSSPRLNWLPCQ